MVDLSVRPWRDRNPLDVTSPQSRSSWWVGQVGMDGMFAVFSSDVYGWRAGFENLIAYKVRHGINTILGIVSRWAPDAAGGNNDAIYARDVSLLTGIGITEVIDLQNGATLLAIGDAMSVVEGGRLPWPQADMEAGLEQAGISLP